MMRWRRGISVKPGRRGDWQQDGRNGEKQEWSRSNQRLRCGPLVCQWLIKVSGGSGAWRANTNSRCAVIEGLGLPQGLANTDYLERYRGIGGCERVYSVFVFVCNLFQKNIFRKEEKLNYKDNISQSLFFFSLSGLFFSFAQRNTLKNSPRFLSGFLWETLLVAKQLAQSRSQKAKQRLFPTCFIRTLQHTTIYLSLKGALFEL